jgi:hypothetical protein
VKDIDARKRRPSKAAEYEHEFREEEELSQNKRTSPHSSLASA